MPSTASMLSSRLSAIFGDFLQRGCADPFVKGKRSLHRQEKFKNNTKIRRKYEEINILDATDSGRPPHRIRDHCRTVRGSITDPNPTV